MAYFELLFYYSCLYRLTLYKNGAYDIDKEFVYNRGTWEMASISEVPFLKPLMSNFEKDCLRYGYWTAIGFFSESIGALPEGSLDS